MISRVRAVFLRYFYEFPGLDMMSEIFFWPIIDILLWGLTIVWIQRQEHDPQLSRLILTGLILFHVLLRGACDLSCSIVREFWDRNLLNLFATPLRLMEWVMGCLALSLVKTLVSIAFGFSMAYIFYGVNVFAPGPIFIFYAASLLLSGWILGLLTSSLIILFGQKVGMLAWMVPSFLSPFCAVFYPVNSLPTWVQSISWCLPMTYIFEAMRQQLSSGTFSLPDLLHNLLLNALYFCIAAAIFKTAFERSRARGLNRLE